MRFGFGYGNVRWIWRMIRNHFCVCVCACLLAREAETGVLRVENRELCWKRDDNTVGLVFFGLVLIHLTRSMRKHWLNARWKDNGIVSSNTKERKKIES